VADVQRLKIFRVLHISEIKRQLVTGQYYLSNCLRLAKQKRGVAGELVLVQVDVGERHVSEGLRDGALQCVIRKVEVGQGACEFAEERIRNCSGELVARQVDGAEVDEVAERCGDGAHEIAIDEVDLFKASECGEVRRDSARNLGLVDGQELKAG